MVHHPVKLHITKAQAHKIAAGKPIRLTHQAIGHHTGESFTCLHPLNHKKLMAAHRKGTGTTVHLTHPELHGTGIFDWVAKAAKGGYKLVKDNWSSIQPHLTKAVDQYLVPTANQYANQYAPGLGSAAVGLARRGLKELTGVGVHGAYPAHHLSGPQYFPGGYVESAPSSRKAPKKSYKKMSGRGIVPAGYSHF